MSFYAILKKFKGFYELVFVLLCIYLTSYYGYLLFHSLTETLGAIVLMMVFIITWHARRILDNSYYLVIGVSFLLLGLLNIAHALSYKGMGVFADNTANLATQLWIASRFYLGLIFLLAPFYIGKKVRPNLILAINIMISFLILASIFYWKTFPVAYVDGVGLSDFKIYSEYVIIAIFLASMFFLWQKRNHFDGQVYLYLQLAILFMALSDFVFTLYVGVYSQLNMIGHIFEIVSFYIIYLVVVKTALVDPQTILYKKLKDSEQDYRESEEKYRSLVELSPDSIVVHESGIVDYVNDACKKMFSLSKDSDFLGKSIFEFIHPDYCDTVRQRVSSVYDSQRSLLPIMEARFLRMGESFPVEIQSAKMLGGGKVKIQTIIRDISERKEMDKAKAEFVTLTSHQLKTPLASMMLAVDLLNRGAAGDLTEEVKEYLDDIHESIVRMNEAIRTMLNVSKFELGTMIFHKEPIDTNDCVERVIGDAKMLMERKGISFKLDIDPDVPKVQFDKQALKLITENLLSNAIRYTEEGGMLSVRLEKRDGRVILSVSDTGCGIPDKDKDKIFRKSFRADNAKKVSNAGTGLGLYMVKSIAEKLGADMWFESEENAGSTFYLSMEA